MKLPSQVKSFKEKRTLYPKSSKKVVPKIQYDPKPFKAMLSTTKYLAFGDSFVNMFVHVQNSLYIKLKGKCIKGLAKADKQDRKDIQKWVKASKQDTQLIFNFGQVDLNLVRYYKVIHKEDYPIQTFQEYVKWIASLNRKAYVIGIFASPIQKQHIINVLQKYNTIQGQDYDEFLLLQQFDKTQSKREIWNNSLQASCKQNGIKFVNIFQHHQQIDPDFIDQNPTTIHLRYLPCILQVKKQIFGLDIDLKKAQQIQGEYQYIKTKRYNQNILILDERKRLESQETKTQQNNSSQNTVEEEISQNLSKEQYFQKNGSCTAEIDNMQSDEKSNNDSNQSNTVEQEQTKNLDQCNEEKQGSQNSQETQQKNHFIASLQISGIDKVSLFFNSVFTQQSDQALQNIAKGMVLKGIKWANPLKYSNQFSLYINLLKDIHQLKKDQSQLLSNGSKKFFKYFTTHLQKIYAEQLNQSSTKCSFSLQKVLNFIVFLTISQEEFKFKIISFNIILLILKQLVFSLFKKLNFKEAAKKNIMLTEYNSIYKIQKTFRKKLDDLFLKQIKEQNYQKMLLPQFLQIIFIQASSEQQNNQRQNRFEKLVEQNPHSLYSTKLLSEILNAFEIQILMYHNDLKIKRVQQFYKQKELTHPNQLELKIQKHSMKLQKKLTKIQIKLQKQREQRRKCSCCYCGRKID